MARGLYIRVRLQGEPGSTYGMVNVLGPRNCAHEATACAECLETWTWDYEVLVPKAAQVKLAGDGANLALPGLRLYRVQAVAVPTAHASAPGIDPRWVALWRSVGFEHGPDLSNDDEREAYEAALEESIELASAAGFGPEDGVDAAIAIGLLAARRGGPRTTEYPVLRIAQGTERCIVCDRTATVVLNAGHGGEVDPVPSCDEHARAKAPA